MASKHSPPQALSLPQFVPYRMAALAKKISDSLARIYSEEFDLSVAEWRILATLAERPQENARSIVALTAMDKVKVSRAVKLLDEKSLLRKRVSREDSRVQELSLSAQGMKRYRAIAPSALAWESRLLEVLEPQERAGFMSSLAKLEGALDSE